ncbi:MAG: DinB family protein [Rhodospirillaceae bacterium]
MTDPALYQTFAQYNKVMNDAVYAVAAEIPDADRKKDQRAFFKSVHGTLNHLCFGDYAWMRRFTCRDYVTAKPDEEIFADFDDMRAARRELDAQIIAWADGLDAPWLAEIVHWTATSYNRERSQPRWLLVSHMFNHQTHHRGQLTTLLSPMEYDVGVTDLQRILP